MNQTETDELPFTKATLTITDICDVFDVSRDTLERWRKTGAFPAPRIMPGGRVLRWGRTEVQDWWASLERDAA